MKVAVLPDTSDKYNCAQKMASKIKGYDPELLWSLVKMANADPPDVPQPAAQWPFEATRVMVVRRNEDGTISDPVREVWMVAEMQTALCMSQRLEPDSHFYEILRLQHSTVHRLKGNKSVLPEKTFQGKGDRVFRERVDHMATNELNISGKLVSTSLGWVLLVDGNNKGQYHTKGELMLFRDCWPEGDITIRTLCMVFLTKEELREYRKIGRKPFGAEALWQRMRDAMEQRFGDPNTKPPAQNYLPHCMRKLLQISCDGASVMHKLQVYVRERFLSDLVPGTDEPHQIERAVVHGMRVRECIKDALTVPRTVIKAFRKSELTTMLMELESQHTQSLKVIHKGRWCEGLCAAIGAVRRIMLRCHLTSGTY